MNPLVRVVVIAIGLLLLLLTASVVGQRWLQQQQDALKQEAIAARKQQFEAVVTAFNLGNPPWDAATTEGVVTAAQLKSIRMASDPNLDRTFWSFEYKPPGSNATPLVVYFAAPKTLRLVVLYQRATFGLALLALTFGAMLLILIVSTLRRRSLPDEVSTGRSDFRSLAGLAKVSVQQGVELEREKIERLRIQEDLTFQQMLLNRALEEKIRLGHDLHDGIIQSLYATGLTLEAAQRSLQTNTTLAGEQLETALGTLNRTIRDVRTYILGLAPENIRVQSFGEAVKSITDTLGAGAAVQFAVQIDDQAAAKLSQESYADLLQIVREAVSNSIRHGKAGRVGIELAQADNDLCLVVEDNGSGFAMEQASRGHGLDNIEARAQRLGAEVRYASRPGSGTRVVITFHANS